MIKIFAKLFIASILVVAQPMSAQGTGLGSTTHFSQGWPRRLLDDAQNIGVTQIRDSLHWNAVELSKGMYQFTPVNSGHVELACTKGMTVLLGIDPRNRLYDNGATAYSAEAMAAFANYIHAIAGRYKGCVTAIEIGNEINGRNGVTGLAATDRAASHTALLKTVWERVKPVHPELKLIGNSTNTVATGFHAKLFKAGALNYVDAIAIHPYRPEPEAVDWEIERLVSAMRATGQMRPIWATEFSDEFAQPAHGAAYLVKMWALLAASGIDQAYWYALIDQKWFPTMGLLTASGARKPAAGAYAWLAAELAGKGPVVRVDHQDPLLFHFRFGSDHHIIWGMPRVLTLPSGAVARSPDGRVIPSPARVSETPVIVETAAAIGIGTAEVHADSLYGYGRAPLTYIARRNGVDHPLRPIDWQWSSYFGSPAFRLMAINPSGLAPVGGGRLATDAVVRFTSVVADADAVASVCMQPTGTKGDGALARILQNGQPIWSRTVSFATGRILASVPFDLAPGDRIELVVGPGANAVQDRVKYRFRIAKPGHDVRDC